MGIIVNLEKSRDQKFQSKIIFPVLKLNLSYFRPDGDKSKRENEKRQRGTPKVGVKPPKVEKPKPEEEKNDKEETYCFCSQVNFYYQHHLTATPYFRYQFLDPNNFLRLEKTYWNI